MACCFALILTALLLRPMAQVEEGKKAFFLPKNPVAAAYVLNRLSNQELIEAPRSEFVYVALLQRKGLEKKFRFEALEGLAKLRQTDILTELLTGLNELDKKGEESSPVIRELAAVLLQFKSDELTAKRTGLENLATSSHWPLSRQIGYAALMNADGSTERVWRVAEVSEERLADVLQAAPMIRDARLRRELYPQIEPLLARADWPKARQAAMAAIAAVTEREGETFIKLAPFVQSASDGTAAIAALQRIPKKSWPKEHAQPLVDQLLAHLQDVPPSQRADTDFINAIQFATDLATLLPIERTRAVNKIIRGLGIRVVVIRTIYEQMLYDKQRIVAEAGQPIEIVFENDDAMPHNLVIVTGGSVEEIGLAAEKMPPDADAQGRLYVPDSPKVLQATKMLASGERAKLSFTAPSDSGEYGYVCTFPGHWRRMTGTLAVVNDVEAYLASHAEPAPPQFTEWKVGDLAPDLEKAGQSRNLEKGKQLFASLACQQCHKLGPAGYSFGPELTDAVARFKGDRAAVFQEIIDPSKIIGDRYRNFSFELKNGDTVSGMIVKEDAESVTIHGGPTDALIQLLPKSSITQRQPQELSLMPAGLLSLISKDEILDLLAFIEAGGKTDPAHKH